MALYFVPMDSEQAGFLYLARRTSEKSDTPKSASDTPNGIWAQLPFGPINVRPTGGVNLRVLRPQHPPLTSARSKRQTYFHSIWRGSVARESWCSVYLYQHARESHHQAYHLRQRTEGDVTDEECVFNVTYLTLWPSNVALHRYDLREVFQCLAIDHARRDRERRLTPGM